MAQLHLIKLCVGVESLQQLMDWRKKHYAPGMPNRHVTRMWPKRSAELLSGGSLYWVIKGQIEARQKIMALEEEIGSDGIRRCAIIMEPELIRTTHAPRRAFQGWRYLEGADAPPDLPPQRAAEDELPAALSTALSEIGLR